MFWAHYHHPVKMNTQLRFWQPPKMLNFQVLKSCHTDFPYNAAYDCVSSTLKWKTNTRSAYESHSGSLGRAYIRKCHPGSIQAWNDSCLQSYKELRSLLSVLVGALSEVARKKIKNHAESQDIVQLRTWNFDTNPSLQWPSTAWWTSRHKCSLHLKPRLTTNAFLVQMKKHWTTSLPLLDRMCTY